MVFLLSGPEDNDTLRLSVPIINDKVASSGRPWVWTMSQGYTPLTALISPRASRTSDLKQT
ncbi:hypothetical protein HNR06_001006 [Nocardiopsis arvandica]|uniref:Uncharacterized protein n=1 Tax=Nocardiopsis sinuspersici TaxID=501010 RepID=A0A7Y9XAI1_9ACTN|nr:hypothetical protein [Nocardiopsis sinuspersici]